jgi:hypothetical protein
VIVADAADLANAGARGALEIGVPMYRVVGLRTALPCMSEARL